MGSHKAIQFMNYIAEFEKLKIPSLSSYYTANVCNNQTFARAHRLQVIITMPFMQRELGTQQDARGRREHKPNLAMNLMAKWSLGGPMDI